MFRAFFFKTLFFFFYRILFRKIKSLRRNVSNVHATTTSATTTTTSAQMSFNDSNNGLHKFQSLSLRSDLSDATMIFNVERALLRSSCLLPYFLLISFEAGSLYRSIVLFLAYPLLCVVSEATKLKIMVFICFLGLKKDSFRAGSAVLPKFFLEDVGLEIFEALQKGSRRVALTNMPQVMVESFLKDYLQIECVVGREIKTVGGYYLGIMEDSNTDDVESLIMMEETNNSSAVNVTIGVTDYRSLGDHQLLSLCKDIYLVSRSEKLTWQTLPPHRYPKPLIFHDGRVVVRPSVMVALQYYMWVPFSVVLSLTRIVLSLSLPYDVAIPVLAFLGLRLSCSVGADEAGREKKPKKRGVLYVCNHRTLLDPLYLCFSLKRNMTALTYSLSRMSEILSPIRTVRLTRNRQEDSDKMDELLSQGDLVVCPEGTTCRESYLLRFSPLFSEITDEVVPVAVGTHVEMFHGTTAGGFKFLDPVFFLMNPSPIYTIQILDKVPTCRESNSTRFDVANQVQKELGKALGFQPTALTRRDKYLILAGNEGIVKSSNNDNKK